MFYILLKRRRVCVQMLGCTATQPRELKHPQLGLQARQSPFGGPGVPTSTPCPFSPAALALFSSLQTNEITIQRPFFCLSPTPCECLVLLLHGRRSSCAALPSAPSQFLRFRALVRLSRTSLLRMAWNNVKANGVAGTRLVGSWPGPSALLRGVPSRRYQSEPKSRLCCAGTGSILRLDNLALGSRRRPEKVGAAPSF